MLYLKTFELLDSYQENLVFGQEPRRIFNTAYPLNIFPNKEFKHIEFDKITIFYGGNGSGKTTLLNIITEKINATSKGLIDKGSYFNYYVGRCDYEMSYDLPVEKKLITSDDVFDYLLNIRAINSSVNRKKEQLSREYLDYKFNKSNTPFEDYEELKMRNATRKNSMSKFVREQLSNNTMVEYSNGESALMFWEREINDNSIYILDEPENSLSAENQLKLKKFIEDSVRFYGCQFIISTHSPFLLNLMDAKIYDLDSSPIVTKKWNELSGVQLYYNFFKEYEDSFK